MNPILPGAPWLIAHRAMLGVNRPYQITLNGIDYVLWQNSKGEISALENICPHLQAPLSSGWICEEHDTIVCPFHALEFDCTGRFLNPDKEHSDHLSSKSLAKPLKISVKGDFIWTYGNQPPQLEIPALHEAVTTQSLFVGVAGDTTIQADFLTSVMVNYDFNHATATHRYPLNLSEVHVSDYEEDGHYSRLKQEIVRDPNTWLEMLKDPTLAFTPKRYVNAFEYAFPSTTCLTADLPIGEVVSLFMLYPESENRTKTFVLVFARTAFTWLVPLLRKSSLAAFGLVVQQDAEMLGQLYARSPAKIRLPKEEVMYYAEKLYHNWPNVN